MAVGDMAGPGQSTGETETTRDGLGSKSVSQKRSSHSATTATPVRLLLDTNIWLDLAAREASPGGSGASKDDPHPARAASSKKLWSVRYL